MTCGYSKEILALYVEDDLPTPDAALKVEAHVLACSECSEYCDQLRNSQAFIRSRFRLVPQQPVNEDALRSVRRNVMSQIDASPSLGWALRIERALVGGFKHQRYAMAGLAFLAVVSVSLVGQMRSSAQRTVEDVAFVGKDTLVRPAGYREWVFVGSSLGLSYSQDQSAPMYHNVFINPSAYREYKRSGKFPDGTVMVLEKFSAETKKEPGLQGSFEKDAMALEMSVKDSSRFDSGWGFYNFTDGGKLKAQAEALPQTAGCLSCHREKAATDHVFTQFYPALRDGSI